MLVNIHTYITAEKEKFENMGIEKDPVINYAPLYFRDEELIGFWVSNDVNSQTNKREITFYALGREFVCDYTKEVFERMKLIVAS